MSKNDGGQAFPLPGTHEDGKTVTLKFPGMSIRDYFAVHALMGILASGKDAGFDERAAEAYAAADAMLKERGK